MRNTTSLAGIVAATAILATTDANAGKPVYGDWGLDTAGMDLTVKPGDNFFKYVNGGWDKATPIPPDRSGYGVDYILSDQAEQRVRGILESNRTEFSGVAGKDATKAHAGYVAFMDQTRVDRLGAQPIAPDLAAIRACKTKAELAALMGSQNDGFQAGIFDVSIREDDKAPARYAVYISQLGLGLPDRDYYLEQAFAAKKAAYRDYVAKLLSLVGWPEPEANATAVVEFETQIAQASWTRAERRDPVKAYRPMSPAELAKAAPGFNWAAFLSGADLGGVPRVVIREDSAIPKIAALYAATPLQVLRAWSAFHVADSSAPYLSQPFSEANFQFRGNTLRGQEQQRERWKRAVAFVDEGQGEAIGRVYVAKYFPPEAKLQIDALVTELREALSKRIDRLDWMSSATKARAHEKLARFTVKIAYPERWRDYSALKVSSTDLVGDERAYYHFEWKREVKRIDQPVDRTEWAMHPQRVDAYYNPSQNEIVFPAGILAPPFFDPNADAAANYGGIGAVIGHEMTHGFDDEGRQYDGMGALSDWWTPIDASNFKAAAAKLNAQYDTYSPFPGVHVKGDQTTGENIADLGGVLIALDAYHASLHGKPASVIDGLSGDQRFFLAFAQTWRAKRREDAVRQQLTSDVHSPEIYRVNGVVRNVDRWYPSFNVTAGETLYLAPADRVRIW